MQDVFWAIGMPFLYVVVVGVLLLGPWFSIYRVRKEHAQKYRSREGVI